MAQCSSLPVGPGRPRAGQIRARREGSSSPGLCGLQRTRLLLQVCQGHYRRRPGQNGAVPTRAAGNPAAPTEERVERVAARPRARERHFLDEGHLPTIRAQLLAAGHSPRVMLRSSVEYSALKLRIKKGEPCVIRQLPEEAEVLEQWLQKLPLEMPYRGQRMASLAHEVLMQLIKAERKQPDPETRRTTLEQQNSLCNSCGAEIQPGPVS